MKLSIIIPAYQSGRTIAAVLHRLKRLSLKGVAKEILVVDDASTDDTSRTVKAISGVTLIRHKTNTGKGGALRSALAHATGDIIYIQDDDLEYDPKDIPDVIAPILAKKADMSFGSRHLNRTNTYSSLPYYLGGKFVDRIISVATGAGISDPLTGSKAFTKKALQKMLPIVSHGFEIEAELTAKAAFAKLAIADVPISYRPRTHRQGKHIRWYHALPILTMLGRLWWNHTAGTRQWFV